MLSAGPEEPNALVELRTRRARASRTRAPRPSSCSTGSRPPARTAGRRCASTCGPINGLLSPLFVGRLLLQDVHVARLVLGEGLRAADPPRRRPRPAPLEADPDHYEKSCAHCDVLVIGGGPAGLAAALAAGRVRRARGAGRRGLRARRPPARRPSRRSTDRPVRPGSRQAIAELRRAAATSACCRAPPCSAPTTAASTAPSSVSAITCPRRRHSTPRQRLWRIVARAVRAGDRRASSDRWSSATTTGPA